MGGFLGGVEEKCLAGVGAGGGGSRGVGQRRGGRGR